MYLLIGVLILAIGLMYFLQTAILKRVNLSVGRGIILLIGFASIATLNVHGIWLGLTIIIVGWMWMNQLESRLKKAEG